jgi:hypothetical protein
MINNIILHSVAFRCILPPGWGTLPNRNYISHLSYIPVHLRKKSQSNQSIQSSQSTFDFRLSTVDCRLLTAD